MEKRDAHISVMITLVAVTVLEIILVFVFLTSGTEAEYAVVSSYSTVMDHASTAPGPGNITVLLDVTNKGTADGRPMLSLRIFTYGDHAENFNVELGRLARDGGHTNVTWQRSFALLDPLYSRVFISVVDEPG